MSQSPKSPAGKDVSLFSGSPGPMKPKASILDEPVDKAKPLDMSSSGSKGPYGKESVFGASPKEKAKEKKRKKSADKDKKRLKTHKKWEFSPMLEKDAWVLWSKVLLWPPPNDERGRSERGQSSFPWRAFFGEYMGALGAKNMNIYGTIVPGIPRELLNSISNQALSVLASTVEYSWTPQDFQPIPIWCFGLEHEWYHMIILHHALRDSDIFPL